MKVTPSGNWPPTPGYDAGYLAVKVDGVEVPDEDLPKWESLFPPRYFVDKSLEVDSELSCDEHTAAAINLTVTLSVMFLPHEVKEG